MRVIDFKIRVSPIELGPWAPDVQDALAFRYHRNGISGTLLINLDTERIQWDHINYTDPDNGETEEAERPLNCDQIICRVEGLYDDGLVTDQVLQEESSTSPPTPFHSIITEPQYSSADLNFLATAHELAIEYFGKFVDYINFDLGQYWVSLGRMSEWGMWYFFQETSASWVEPDDTQRSVIAGSAQYFNVISEEPEAPTFYHQGKELVRAYWTGMQQSLQETRQVDIVNRLILNAKRHLANGDYRMAAVESVAALEVGLVNFVENRVKKKGVSGTALESYKFHLGIAAHLKLLLPLVLEKDELESWLSKRQSSRSGVSGKQKIDNSTVIQRCLELNSLRNDVVHEGAVPSGKIAIIERGMTAIELLVDFIHDSDVQP